MSDESSIAYNPQDNLVTINVLPSKFAEISRGFDSYLATEGERGDSDHWSGAPVIGSPSHYQLRFNNYKLRQHFQSFFQQKPRLFSEILVPSIVLPLPSSDVPAVSGTTISSTTADLNNLVGDIAQQGADVKQALEAAHQEVLEAIAARQAFTAQWAAEEEPAAEEEAAEEEEAVAAEQAAAAQQDEIEKIQDMAEKLSKNIGEKLKGRSSSWFLADSKIKTDPLNAIVRFLATPNLNLDATEQKILVAFIRDICAIKRNPLGIFAGSTHSSDEFEKECISKNLTEAEEIHFSRSEMKDLNDTKIISLINEKRALFNTAAPQINND